MWKHLERRVRISTLNSDLPFVHYASLPFHICTKIKGLNKEAEEQQ